MKKLQIYLFIIPLLTLLFGACKDSSTGAGGDSGGSAKPTLDAVINYAPQNPDVDTKVTLDAGNSKDDQDIGYQIQWNLESKPSGSAASINSATSEQANFTPDVAGDYKVKLEISNNSKKVSDSKTTTISAISANNTQKLSGDINSDKTLKNLNEDPTIPDYLVTGNLNVNAVLTVEPGVLIQVQEDVGIFVGNSGALIAEGEEGNMITFTSSNISGGLHWKGIFVNTGTSQNSMKYVQVMYAGNSKFDFVGDDYKAAVGVDQGGKLSIEHSSFSNNSGFGVYVDEQGTLGSFDSDTLSNNDKGVGLPAKEVDNLDNTTAFSGNSKSDVIVFGTTLASDQDATWKPLEQGTVYNVVGNLDIEGNLTIEQGARFEMDEDVIWYVNGAMTVNGASGKEVTFTTSDDSHSLHWKGLYFNSANNNNALNYAKISYAGNSKIDFVGDDFMADVGVDQDAHLSVKNSTISNSKGYGLYVDEQGVLTDFSVNSFSDNQAGVYVPANEVDDMDTATTFSNNAVAAVEIEATTYGSGKASTWQPLNGTAAYRVTGDVYVDGDLTIAAGAQFELDENVMMEVTGSIIAEGTSNDMIKFTTSNLDGQIHWKGLFVKSSSSLNKLNYVKVTYAGNSKIDFVGDDYQSAIGIDQDAKLAITNSEIANNNGFGVYADEQGIITGFSSNSVHDNGSGVGIPANEVDDMDNTTSFSNNANGDVLIFGTILASSKDVRWKGLANGAKYRVLGNIQIDGILRIGPGAYFENDEDVQWYISGVLDANGEPGDEVTFTTSNQAGGIRWKGLLFASSDTRNSLNYAKVSYAGNSLLDLVGDDFKADIGVDQDAHLTITNSTISESAAFGVYSIGITNDIESSGANNTFTNIPQGNVY